ncbi:MAG: putative ABC transporter permease [Sphaerochaeta sp.]|nr:putative ABC transporter permease [Sphaerochaeta sp.]
MQFDQYFLYFVLYAMIGYICELVYCGILDGRLTNRGFLFGPYLPIYGFGALLVVVPLMSFDAHPIAVFAMAFLLTSALEYVTSFLLEKIFQTKLWDYSKRFANINGRVCLLNSILFGLLGLAATYLLHPAITTMVSRIPAYVLDPLSNALLILLSIDTTSSVYRMSSFQRQLTEFRIRVRELEERIDLLAKQRATPSLVSLGERLDRELDELKTKVTKRLKWIYSAFPSVTGNNEEQRLQLELLKMNFRSYREKKKEQRKKR